MASNYTPEEIEQLKAREADEIKRLGQATIETRMALLDAAAGVKGLTASLTKGFGSLGTSAIDLTKQMYAGELGASVFNKSIGATADALGDLVGMIPYVGKVLKTIVKGGSEYVQAVNKQSDALFKNYQDMSKFGATTAGGIQDFYNNLKNMNYNAETEMALFVNIVRENSTTLAYFGKTVGSGLSELATVAGAVADSELGTKFKEMGMSIEDINQGTVGVMKMQVLTGNRQKMTTDQLIAATGEYITKVDLLAKITGKNIQQQQALEASALEEEKYAGYRLGLLQQGDEVSLKKAQAADDAQKYLAEYAPSLRKGFLNALSGTLTTDESKNMQRTMPETMAMINSGNFGFEELVASMQREAKKALPDAIGQAQVGINNKFFTPVLELARLGGTQAIKESLEQAKQDQTITDQGAKNNVKIQDEQRNARDKLQDLINRGIVPVTNGMTRVAAATESTIAAFTKLAEMAGVDVSKREREIKEKTVSRSLEGARVSGSPEAKASAEKYLGKAISDQEFSALIKATHAEAAGGKQSNQQEQAMIMASVLNRARTDKGGIIGALNAKNQFQSVTGTANAPGPSEHYLKGPEKERLQSIEGATKLLQNISTQQKNFTAASAAAYGPGTNIGYRNKMLAEGGTTVGGSVFQTAPINAPVAQAPATAKPVDKRFSDMARANQGRQEDIAQAPATTDKKMANGGIIPAAPGGVDVVAAEAGMNEAFVPLPDGKTIPVQIAGTDEQMGMMSAQLNRLDDIVRIMQTQLGVSQKLLKYAQ